MTELELERLVLGENGEFSDPQRLNCSYGDHENLFYLVVASNGTYVDFEDCDIKLLKLLSHFSTVPNIDTREENLTTLGFYEDGDFTDSFYFSTTILDYADLIDWGTSVRCAFATSKGKLFLKMMEPLWVR